MKPKIIGLDDTIPSSLSEHLRLPQARAQAIAFWMFSNRGIVTTRIEMPSNKAPETTLHIVPWDFTRQTGISFEQT